MELYERSFRTPSRFERHRVRVYGFRARAHVCVHRNVAFFLRENRDRDQDRARDGHGRRGHGYEGLALHGKARELHANGSGHHGPERAPEYMQLASYRTGDYDNISGNRVTPQFGIRGIRGVSSSHQIPQPNTDTPSNTTLNDLWHSAADQLSETVAVEGTG